MVALHCSDPAAMYLSAMARMRDPSITAVSDALHEERTVLRQHAMRRTLWVLTAGMARLAHASCTVALAGREWKRLVSMVEDSNIATDGAKWVAAAKRDTLAALNEVGEATARQLGQLVPALRAPLLMAQGKPYAATQGAHTRILLNLGFDGVIVRGRQAGSWVTSEYSWSLMERWFPGGIVGDDPHAAAAGLARAYLGAFGPATTADVQWWAGWTMAMTKRALDTIGAVAVRVEDGDAWVLPDDIDVVSSPKPWVAFLPALDPTVMGWKQRDWYLGEHGQFGRSLFDRNGNAGPTIWIDGEIVGAWAQRKTGEVSYQLLTDVGPDRAAQIETAAERLHTLIGQERVNVRFPPPIQRDLLA